MLITTFEHEILTKQDFANPTDFDWLMEQSFDGLSIQRKNQQWQLKFSHYIGVIGLPSGHQLEILPKISKHNDIDNARQWVQRMLMDIWQTLIPKQLFNISYQTALNSVHHLPINQWLLNIFWQLWQDYQPNQQYQALEQNHSFLQGKLLIKQQIQYNHFQPHKFFHQIEQFAHNTACNRLVKTTINQLFDRQVLQNLPIIWQQVSTIVPQEYQTIFYQSQQELYALPSIVAQKNRYFIDFCYSLLTLQQASQHGQWATPTLLINMQVAFEKWVIYQIKQQFNHNDDIVIEHKQQALTVDNHLLMKPDIWVETANDVIVMDVKWKLIGDISQIKLADMYQLLTYAQQFDATQAWLIVPTDDKNKTKQEIQLVKSMGFQVFFVPFYISEQ